MVLPVACRRRRACAGFPGTVCSTAQGPMGYTADTGRFFTRMSARPPRPAICGSCAPLFRAQQSASAPAVPSARACHRDSFRPFALSLIGLAVAVALWGYSYRISRYSAVRTSRVFVAKLWVENRLAVAARRATARNSVKQFGAGADAAPLAAVQAPALARAAVRRAQPRLRLLLCLVFPAPLRSPPALLPL